MAPTKVLHVLGTRPNFVKMAPVVEAIGRRLPETRQVLVHTGQHYDRMMSEIFFEELGMPRPDHTLEVGSGSHAVQTARVIERIEPVLESERPDLVLVPGDVNSTLAAALTAAKMDLPVGHVESGLRSGDRTMPEELNRIVVDHLAGMLFTHSAEADLNLSDEGIDPASVHLVGNTMIDTLVRLEDHFRAIGRASAMGLEPGDYLLVTLHRPALVDGPLLGETLAALGRVSADLPVIFPVHPRTRAMIAGVEDLPDGLHLIEPVGYLDFLSLESDAAAVLTDSGGIQEETTYLGIPCFTLRDNTERPVTIDHGTNRLLGLDPSAIERIPEMVRSTSDSAPEPPPLWDGAAGERIAALLADS
jgi:UDP-N-acetylglucosamine 2-epimerase (non-hydrolysing)